MEQSQFTSPFWHYYIVIIVVCSILWVSYLLWSQNVVKHKKDEDVKTTGHSWDGIEEYNNPLHLQLVIWYFILVWAISKALVLMVNLGQATTNMKPKWKKVTLIFTKTMVNSLP